MVDHLTTVAPERGLPAPRAAALGAALADLGFRRERQAGRGAWSSTAVGATAARAHLRKLGFLDREYRVVLEYVRRWGYL